MNMTKFPELLLSDWKPSRDTIHHYSKILGKIRAGLTPKQKHWWHISLRCSTAGLVTTPVPYNGKRTFEVELDFCLHSVNIRTSDGGRSVIKIEGQKPVELASQILDQLLKYGIEIDLDKSQFSLEASPEYNRKHVENYWKALSQIDQIFKKFKGNLRKETSPVQLWPHHFDLAFLWFSGRLVPGEDPMDEEYSDEQMNFGFSTGDEGISDPYFFITAYPFPEKAFSEKLPNGVKWNREGFTGAVLMYEKLVSSDNSKEVLTSYLDTVHKSVSKSMVS